MEQSLISVGIDIGTSTTQVIFCKIVIENLATAWTVPSVRIVDKQIFYKSEIHFTPMIDSNTLDATRIKEIIVLEYGRARITPQQVSTGAIIITGEAARKKNAEEILNTMSDYAGDFVVTTAGPDLEGILAGKGSGACAYSKEHSLTIMNFDIGGGTTNVAVYKNGDVVDSACFDIGGRLIKLDQSNRFSYFSKKMLKLMDYLNLKLNMSEPFDEKRVSLITKAMAKAIINISQGNYEDEVLQLLITDHGLRKTHKIDAVCFSGGVADCIGSHQSDLLEYNDIGVMLGRSLNEAIKQSNLTAFIAKETIRATVIGAGVHTTNISGSTIHYSQNLLPIKNVPVIKLTEEEEKSTGSPRSEAIEKRLKWVIHEESLPLVALSIKGDRRYGFDALQSLAEDIIKGMQPVIRSDHPLIVVVEHDIGKALGLSILRNLSQKKPVICIDSIVVDNGDYIDVGAPVADGQVLPVIIKTLLFGY